MTAKPEVRIKGCQGAQVPLQNKWQRKVFCKPVRWDSLKIFLDFGFAWHYEQKKSIYVINVHFLKHSE